MHSMVKLSLTENSSGRCTLRKKQRCCSERSQVTFLIPEAKVARAVAFWGNSRQTAWRELAWARF